MSRMLVCMYSSLHCCSIMSLKISLHSWHTLRTVCIISLINALHKRLKQKLSDVLQHIRKQMCTLNRFESQLEMKR